LSQISYARYEAEIAVSGEVLVRLREVKAIMEEAGIQQE
jgi:hypothetical protein